MKKILSCILSFALILSIAGCSKSEGEGATTTTDDNVVDISGVDLDLDKNVDISGKVLTYVGNYDITTAGDVKPAYTYFKKTYGATIEVDQYSDAELVDKLTSMVSSGKSPDLVDQRQNSFPYHIGKKMYMPLDEYMDLKAPQWADVSSYIERYAINGEHYYYPWAYFVSPRFLIYNRAKFNDLGIDDPKTLYEQNNWTWDTMLKCMNDFVVGVKNDVPDAIGVYGTVATSFINSAGSAMVTFENGKLVNNLNDANIDRAQNFLENLKKQGLSLLYYGDTMSNVAVDPVVSGYSAFHAVGDWCIANYCQLQDSDPEMDIFFVPFPKDPDADRYYQTLDTFAYLVPNGAPNPQASCIFINCVRLSKTDPTLMESTKASILKQKKYTDEQYEMWNYFQTVSNFDPDDLILDYAYNVDTATCENVVQKLCEEVPFVNNEDTQSWSVMRGSMSPLLDHSLSEINASLDNV